VLFKQNYEDYGLDVALQPVMEVQTAGGGKLVRTGVVRSFRVGTKELKDAVVTFVPVTSFTASRPELGTFPLQWFDSVYLNHTLRLVAFEPKFKQLL